jgi:hypothetical protein
MAQDINFVEFEVQEKDLDINQVAADDYSEDEAGLPPMSQEEREADILAWLESK